VLELDPVVELELAVDLELAVELERWLPIEANGDFPPHAARTAEPPIAATTAALTNCRRGTSPTIEREGYTRPE
jgi:hypothetical protein